MNKLFNPANVYRAHNCTRQLTNAYNHSQMHTGSSQMHASIQAAKNVYMQLTNAYKWIKRHTGSSQILTGSSPSLMAASK